MASSEQPTVENVWLIIFDGWWSLDSAEEVELVGASEPASEEAVVGVASTVWGCGAALPAASDSIERITSISLEVCEPLVERSLSVSLLLELESGRAA